MQCFSDHHLVNGVYYWQFVANASSISQSYFCVVRPMYNSFAKAHSFVVVRGQQRNVRKSMQHVQNCFFCLGRVQAASTGIRIFLKRHILRIIYLRRHRLWKSPLLFFLSFLPFLVCFISFCFSTSNILSEFCTVPKRIPKMDHKWSRKENQNGLDSTGSSCLVYYHNENY